MKIKTAVQTCLAKYIDFTGRASRSEYWWFVLAVVIAGFIISIIGNMIFGYDPQTLVPREQLSTIFGLLMFFPLLSAAWRRMQDSGRQGWLVLLPMIVSLISFVGLVAGIGIFGLMERDAVDAAALDAVQQQGRMMAVSGVGAVAVVQLILSLLMIYWLVQPSDPRTNRHGPPPAN